MRPMAAKSIENFCICQVVVLCEESAVQKGKRNGAMSVSDTQSRFLKCCGRYNAFQIGLYMIVMIMCHRCPESIILSVNMGLFKEKMSLHIMTTKVTTARGNIFLSRSISERLFSQLTEEPFWKKVRKGKDEPHPNR